MTKRAEEPPPTPAHLFLDLWRAAAAMRPSQRSGAQRMAADFLSMAATMAAQEDAARAAEGLAALISGTNDTEKRGRHLAVMYAIDMLFAAVHPRVPRAPTRRAAQAPAWLMAMQDRRMLEGCFLATDDLALIPRGPLLRTSREPDASSADTLADRFAYLGAIPRTIDENGLDITVRVRCIGGDVMTGVEAISDRGSERIAFIPVAEGANDLDIHRVERGSTAYAFFGPATGLPAGRRYLDAITALGLQDIAVAPELVMRAEETRIVQTALISAPACPRLLLVGTEHSSELEEGQSFNEAVLLNSVGFELWRQRKLWPAKLSPDDACRLGLCDTGADASIPEDNASGNELQLVDIDGFGRVLVLVCQDLQLAASARLIEQAQPDWVLIPVLADNLAEGRWAHRRALAISENSQSRFVGVTSSTLAARYATNPEIIGFALGPARPTAGDEPAENERASAFVRANPDMSPAAGTTRWQHGSEWVQSYVAVTTVTAEAQNAD